MSSVSDVYTAAYGAAYGAVAGGGGDAGGGTPGGDGSTGGGSWGGAAPPVRAAVGSRAYRLLPDHIRDADVEGALFAWLAGAEQALSPELLWLESCDPDNGPVWPVDPQHCPGAWLGWLAWLRGRDVRGLSDDQARWLLGRTGRTGSDQGIADAVAATLTGSGIVRVGHPSEWEVVVVLSTADVVDIAATTDAAQRAAPAGFKVTVSPTAAVTLADIDAAYADLAAISATGKTLDQLRFG